MSNFVKTIYGRAFGFKKSYLLLNVFNNYLKTIE